VKAQQWFTHPIGLIASAVLATLLWGSATPVVKIGYTELNIGSHQTFEQWVFAGYRFTLAGIILVLFAWWMKKKNLESPVPVAARARWFRVSRLALIQTFAQYVCFYIGVSLSTGMQGAIITGATSFFQMLVVRFMDQNERFTSSKTLGLCLGFAGVAVVTIAQAGFQMQLNMGDLFLILAAFFGGFGNVLSRHESRDLPVIWLTGRQMLLGGLGLTIIGSVRAGIAPFQWNAGSLLLLLYLSFLSAAAFGLWNLVMKYNPVGKVSLYLFLIPVFGVGLSAWLLGEQFNLWIIVALLLVVGGILTVNRPVSKRPAIVDGVEKIG